MHPQLKKGYTANEKIFNVIKNKNNEELKSILASNPDKINAISKQPPKKDDGQSPLQVALKFGNLDAANLLLDYNADVNFIESDRAYFTLERILKMGADINAKDSYGNTCLERAISDARQMLPKYNCAAETVDNDRKITEELKNNFLRIFH